MIRVLMLTLVGCAPTSAVIAPADDAPDGPRMSACAAGPGDLSELSELPVTVFYEGPLAHQDVVEGDTIVVDTPVQREWSVVSMQWGPDAGSFGNLDADPEGAGHGVLLGAYRSSTCGMQVVDVAAWRVPDGAGTAYVELTVEDTSGACEDVCDMEQWVGVAVGIPIADFPFSGPVVGCVDGVDTCE